MASALLVGVHARNLAQSSIACRGAAQMKQVVVFAFSPAGFGTPAGAAPAFGAGLEGTTGLVET